MTAELLPLFPTGDRADETVRTTIKALLEGRGIGVDDAARHLGVNKTTLYRKLNGHGSDQAFKAGEVATLARLLGVKVGELYEGLGGTFVPPDPGAEGPTIGWTTDRYSNRHAELRAVA